MPKHFDYDEFVRVWNESPSGPAVAEKLGISLGAVYSRVRYARGKGYSLRGNQITGQLDWPQFVALYNSCATDTEVAQAEGITIEAVKQRAWHARNRGYELVSRTKTPFAYAYLAAIIDEKSSIDNHGSSGQRLRISISSPEVLAFVQSLFPGGSLENHRGKYRLTYQKPEIIQRIMTVTERYRKKEK